MYHDKLIGIVNTLLQVAAYSTTSGGVHFDSLVFCCCFFLLLGQCVCAHVCVRACVYLCMRVCMCVPSFLYSGSYQALLVKIM